MRILMPLALLLVCMGAARAGEELKPGAQKGLATDRSGYTLDLYLPKAYAEDAKRVFPILFLHSPSGNPGFMKLEKWSEKHGVILLANNASKNGEWAPVIESQDACWRWAEQKLRVHACLRFAIGMSGAAWASSKLSARYPDEFAGVVFMGHSGNGDLPPKHCAAAFIQGEADDVHPASAVRSAERACKSRGNPTRALYVPGRKHQGGTLEEKVEMLTWMLNLQRFRHPKLSPADLKANQAEVKSRAAALASITAPEERAREAGELAALPDVEKHPDFKTIAAAWFSATAETARSRTDPLDQFELFSDAVESPRARFVAAAELAKVNAELAALRKDPKIQTESNARQLLARIAGFEAEAGANKAKQAQVAQGYEALASKFPETRAAKRAQEALKDK